MKKLLFVALAAVCGMNVFADGNIVSTARVTFSNSPVGSVNGNAKFSVGENKQVYFSQGNLQYVPSTGVWSFAEHQYDVLGSSQDPAPTAATSTPIDLFQFGHSGCTYGGVTYTPYHYSSDGYCDVNKDIQYTNMDWGVYNAIFNGGNAQGHWRTLSYSEWNYLLYSRPNLATGEVRYASAKVNDVLGMILFPDVWNRPSGISIIYGTTDAALTNNAYTAEQWALLEAAGAVFLPCTDYRLYDGTMANSPSYGFYWTSSYYNSSYACNLTFTSSSMSLYSSSYPRYYGMAVRLVQDVPVVNE